MPPCSRIWLVTEIGKRITPHLIFQEISKLCCAGFFMSYNASELAPNITRAVRALQEQYPNAPLYVAGHSMGAAMAHICALDLKFTLGFENVNVYSYGSPRVGNTIFKDFFNNVVNVSVCVPIRAWHVL